MGARSKSRFKNPVSSDPPIKFSIPDETIETITLPVEMKLKPYVDKVLIVSQSYINKPKESSHDKHQCIV